ncbi:AMP-binding protein [Gordonia insulae]|uniref:Short-chain-fatty-acid--CoA ligase n=1 Tax=Gordonia insulae TaxID=2420509 RepID=A0A3G8JLJ7_9ACTN|nr:AMP-binding protein [Gordonia insulae]AZG45465.1 Short-chain-fatty-acid--CoA ligase [Gordonia insulae]
MNVRAVPDRLRQHYLDTGLWSDTTLGSLLLAGLTDSPDQTFRVWSKTDPASLTFIELESLARRFAQGLVARGVRPGTRVAFQLPNCLEAAVTFIGCSLAGMVLVPIAGYYGRKELTEIVNGSGATVLIVQHGAFDEGGNLDVPVGACAAMPMLQEVVVCGTSGVDGALDFDDLIAGGPIESAVTTSADDPVLLAYTSGTSGQSKGVVHTHRTIVAEVRNHLALMIPANATPQITASPIAHAAGMTLGLLAPLYRGEPINVVDSFDVDFILSICGKNDLAPGGGASVFLSALIDHPGFTDRIARRMGYVILGGSTVPEDLVRRAEDRGVTVLRSYGLTEHPTISAGLIGDDSVALLTTDGQPLPGVEVEVRLPDGTIAPSGIEGHIHSRGPDLCAGYTDPSLTAESFDNVGWFATGDLGVMDSAGHLSVTGRAKDLIIRNGVNISPAEVENALLSCPGVADVSIVGVPDARTGERSIAFVTPENPDNEPTLADVRLHLGAVGLAKPKWPEELRVVSSFPRTPSGKIRKIDLRASLDSEA